MRKLSSLVCACIFVQCVCVVAYVRVCVFCVYKGCRHSLRSRVSIRAAMSNFVGGKNKREIAKVSVGEGMVGHDAMGRRVWDKEYFSKLEGEGTVRTKVVSATTESIKERVGDLGFEAQVNQRRIVTNSSSKSSQGGFYCEPCDILLRDSAAYLDHVNGKTHNKVCGMNMNVEQVSVDRVIAKMKMIRLGMHTLDNPS